MAIPDWLAGDPRIVHHDHRLAAVGRTAPWPRWVPDDVRCAVELSGIPALWTHQAQLADLVFGGTHAAIATPTASGKSLAYWLPIMAATASSSPVLGVTLPDSARTRLTTPRHTALYLSPTKALAHDQWRAVRELAPRGLFATTLDGDSTDDERRLARHHAQVVLSNPDMLHRSVLPNHARWARVLGQLRYVVIDEAHRYRGVFGAHVAQVIRRLRRLCHHYGADPVFVLASATAPGLAETGGRLIGEACVAVVDEDAAPRAARDVLLWQPADGPSRDAAELMAQLVDDGRQTITFVASRTMAELIAVQAQDRVSGPGRIASYRAGYLADDRRALEADLQTRALTGVAATNALELGVDVAGMDAVVIAGFPGTLAALWQQAGRAGRRDRDGLVVVMAREDPLDAWLFQHPERIFDAPVEQTVLHPANPQVMGPHLAAAAAECVLTQHDVGWFGPTMPSVADTMASQKVLRKRRSGWYWTRPGRPTDHIDLRAIGDRALDIIDRDTGRVVGQVDPGAADRTVHPGAVYLHQGDQFLVDEYLPDECHALVHAARPGWYTQPESVTEVRLLRTSAQRPLGRGLLHRGDVELTSHVTSYLRRDEVTGDVWDSTPLDLPRRRMATRAMWWTVPDELASELHLGGVRLAAAAHAAEHTAIGLLPAFAPCDRWDIGGVSTVLHPDTDACTIVVHDGMPGGAGFADRGYAVAEQWWRATLDRLLTCPCEAGCPACVVSPKCGSGNQALNKSAAAVLVAGLLGEPQPDQAWQAMRTPSLSSPPIVVPRLASTVHPLVGR